MSADLTLRIREDLDGHMFGKQAQGGVAVSGGTNWMQIAHVAAITGEQQTVTTGAIDTTGADLIVGVLANYNTTPLAGHFSDSKSNTWAILTPRGTAEICTIFYSRPSSVGSGHTFSFNPGVTNYPSMCVLALSGSVASPFDQENGAVTAGATSLATGSITPTQNGALIIVGLTTNAAEGGTPTINLSFAVTDTNLFSPGNSMGSSEAWIEQAAIAAINPTWSFVNSIPAATAIASFKHP